MFSLTPQVTKYPKLIERRSYGSHAVSHVGRRCEEIYANSIETGCYTNIMNSRRRHVWLLCVFVCGVMLCLRHVADEPLQICLSCAPHTLHVLFTLGIVIEFNYGHPHRCWLADVYPINCTRHRGKIICKRLIITT